MTDEKNEDLYTELTPEETAELYLEVDQLIDMIKEGTIEGEYFEF